MPKISLPPGTSFVIVQPQVKTSPKKTSVKPYVGILTGIVSLPGHVVVVGYQGTIWAYDRASGSWTHETSPVRSDFYGVTLVGSKTLWVCGDRGVLLRSDDGGVHWNAVSTGAAPLFLNAVSFPTPRIGYAVGEKGTILKTVDGGAHWARVPSSTGNNLYGVSFSDGDHGVVAGWHKTLLTTRDGGSHFTPVDLPIEKLTRQTPSLNNVWSQGKTFLVAGDHGLLFRSEDGGKTFGMIHTQSLRDLYGVCRMGDGRIAVAGERGELLLLSESTSRNWTRTRPLGNFHGADWLGISCGPSHLRASGSKGTILLPENLRGATNHP